MKIIISIMWSSTWRVVHNCERWLRILLIQLRESLLTEIRTQERQFLDDISRMFFSETFWTRFYTVQCSAVGQGFRRWRRWRLNETRWFCTESLLVSSYVAAGRITCRVDCALFPRQPFMGRRARDRFNRYVYFTL